MHGVSTRSVDDLVKAMDMTGISKSQVSRLCAEIDEKVQAFLNRPIEGDWPYLWIDATYVKVRQSGRIVSVAVIVAVGVNADGRREVLGLAIGPSEAETFWTDFLRKLARRALRGDLRRSRRHQSCHRKSVCTPHGSAVGFTSCATCLPMPIARAAVSSPPSSAPPLFRTTPKPPASNSDKLPTNCVRRCRSSRHSWTRPRSTCSPS